jgi:hypothetical protein
LRVAYLKAAVSRVAYLPRSRHFFSSLLSPKRGGGDRPHRPPPPNYATAPETKYYGTTCIPFSIRDLKWERTPTEDVIGYLVTGSVADIRTFVFGIR